jgi:uncharacterized membrane protein
MVCIAAVSFVAGLAFLLMGAWPVFGFFGLDVLLIWWAIERNYGDARRKECVSITDEEIVIIRMADRKSDEIEKFVRPWVRIYVEEDRDRELIGRLFVTSRDVRSEIGSFLAPHDRKSLAVALNEILARPNI